MDDWLPPEARNRPTSAATNDYNCIAWALGDDTHWWWPGEPDAVTKAGHYWPDDLPTAVTIDTFTVLFGRHGFEPCESGGHEDGFEKLALYALADGEPSHVSRELPTGAWTSKYGSLADCEHDQPEDAECRPNGQVVRFYRRPHGVS